MSHLSLGPQESARQKRTRDRSESRACVLYQPARRDGRRARRQTHATAVFTFHLMKQDSTERERPGMRTGTREKRGVIDNQERTIGKDKRVNYNIYGWGRPAVPHQRRKPPGRGGAPPGPRGGNPGEKNWGSISVGRGEGGRKEKREITRRKERLTFFIHPLAFDQLVKNPLTHGRRTNTGAFIYILRGSLLAQLLVDARPMSSARFS